MDERGQGLTELLIAAAVISILSAALIPRLMWDGGRMSLDFEAARLAAELQYFRELVMTTQRVHSDFPSVSAETLPRFFIVPGEYYILKNAKRERIHEIPSGIMLKPPSREAVFDKNGNGVTMSIILRAGQEIRYVIIDLAGRVRVSRDPPKS